jgi:hypothetical protein
MDDFIVNSKHHIILIQGVKDNVTKSFDKIVLALFDLIRCRKEGKYLSSNIIRKHFPLLNTLLNKAKQ